MGTRVGSAAVGLVEATCVDTRVGSAAVGLVEPTWVGTRVGVAPEACANVATGEGTEVVSGPVVIGLGVGLDPPPQLQVTSRSPTKATPIENVLISFIVPDRNADKCSHYSSSSNASNGVTNR